MNTNKEKIRKQFDTLFGEWEKAIQDPKIQFSSRPKDYIDNEPYRQMVNMGKDALPFIIDKIEKGAFLLNQAVEKISGTTLDKIIGQDDSFAARPFLSEQEKSKVLVKWWKSNKK